MSKQKEYLYAMQYTLLEVASSDEEAQAAFDNLALEGETANGTLVKIATKDELEEAADVLLMIREKLNEGKPKDRRFEEGTLKDHFSGYNRDFGIWLPYLYDAANLLTQKS